MKIQAYTLASPPSNQTTPFPHLHKNERNHHEQSNKPRTYHKGVPTCRGIKNRCRRRGGKLFHNPLSLPHSTPTEQLQETTIITIKNKHNHEKDNSYTKTTSVPNPFLSYCRCPASFLPFRVQRRKELYICNVDVATNAYLQ